MTDDDYWIRHLKKHHVAEMDVIVNGYPKEKVLNIDVSKIVDAGVQENVLNYPEDQADQIRLALREAVPYPKEKWSSHNFEKVIVRFKKGKRIRKIKEIGKEDIDKLITVNASVTSVSGKEPKKLMVVFQCESGHFTNVNNRSGGFRIPSHCSSEHCDSKKFEEITRRGTRVNRQWIYVQEPISESAESGIPSILKCEVIDDLCWNVYPGNAVKLNGIFKTQSVWKGSKLLESEKAFLEISSIELEPRNSDGVHLTKEDEKELRELAKREGFYDLLISSIAPSIYGMRMLKEAVALMLFEGVTGEMKDGTDERGHINVLCVTDPSMAKTKLLRFVAHIAPRGIFTTATTSTKVGLIAPIVRDEATGQYTVQAGAYMIANGGIICMDEVSELTMSDFKYLNEAMENGEVHINKAGINATIPTRASLLAACNPINGSFDPMRPLADQVKIPESTLSRFDLKILLLDVASEERDRAMIQKMRDSSLSKDSTEEYPYLTPETIRKYVALGRKLKPKFTKESEDIIIDFYVRLRKETNTKETMKITPRQATACFRLAEAHAKARLSDMVEVIDAKAATNLFEMTFRNVNTDPVTGNLDLSRTEHRATRESMVGALFRAIKEGGSNGITEDALIGMMSKYDRVRVQQLIRDLKHEGKIIEPKNGILKEM